MYHCAKCGYPQDTKTLKCYWCMTQFHITDKAKWFTEAQFAADQKRRFPRKAGKVITGVPFVRNDHLQKHHDWALGKDITSKSERDKQYKKRGWEMESHEEHRRKYPGQGKLTKGKVYGYPGQTNHKSAAERSLGVE